ncbi:MAG: hypothetical protein ABIO70_25960 [Pseudomonadota bacterium]
MPSTHEARRVEAAKEYLACVGVHAEKDPFIEVALASVKITKPTVVNLHEVVVWASAVKRVLAERPRLDLLPLPHLRAVVELYRDADQLWESIVDLLGEQQCLQGMGLADSVNSGAKVKYGDRAFTYTLHHLWSASGRRPRLTEHLLRLAAYASGHDASAPAGADKRWGRVLGDVRKKPTPLLLEDKWRPAGALLAALQQPDPAQRPTEAHSLEQIAEWVLEGGLRGAIQRTGLVLAAPPVSPE